MPPYCSSSSPPHTLIRSNLPIAMAPKKQTPPTGTFQDSGADASLPGSRPPPPANSWVPMVVGNKELEPLIQQGLLPPKGTKLWETQKGALYPGRTTFNIPVFDWYFIRGLSLPICSFLQGILHYYRLELPQLHPNSILQLAIFVHLCEAFLGIAPHFNLWRYLFICKRQAKNNQLTYLGSAILQL